MGPILCKTKFEVDSRVNKKALPILGWGGKSSLQKSKWRRRKCNAPWRQAHTQRNSRVVGLKCHGGGDGGRC